VRTSQRHKHRIPPKLQQVIIAVLSLVLVFNLGWVGLRTLSAYRTQQKYQSAMGIIVDVTYQKPDKSSSEEHHYPVVEFQTSEGKTVVFKDKVGGLNDKYQTGQLVPILYNKEKPFIALIESPQEK
jgi:hypothetical protein